jgi:hypothetical protein
MPDSEGMAQQNKEKDWTVRRWIAEGHLKIDRRKFPMRIVGGRKPLTPREFLEELAPVLAKVPKGTMGQTESGDLELLRGDRIERISFDSRADRIGRVRLQLEQILA